MCTIRIVNGFREVFAPNDENVVTKINGFTIHILNVEPDQLQFSNRFSIEISYTALTSQVNVSCGTLVLSVTENIITDSKLLKITVV